MITSRDMAMPVAPPQAPAFAPMSPLVAAATQPVATSLRERILLTVLFVTVLTSSIAFIEPSPHDVLMGVLAVACLIAGVRFHRLLALPLLLLLIWNFAGLMALFHVTGKEKTLVFVATSIYLAVAAMLFAMLFAENTMARLATMRTAYILSAAFAALCGAAGYFRPFPGAEIFSLYGRALGMFKDPNVYGPFLILPALLLLERMLSRRIDILSVIFTGIILFGLLLGFSRGSWFHFAVSLTVVIALDFLTASTPKVRVRIFALTIAGLFAAVALLAILLSFESIGAMFAQRAQLIQNYDVGQGGRFRLQELALNALLDHPFGMGPFEFANVYGLQQHNVYLQAFLVYGWAGGIAYFTLLISTVWVGLRTAFTHTPWQSYSIVAVGALIGQIAEGFVIDSDHWRHFFLILGIIWGLAAATAKTARPA